MRRLMLLALLVVTAVSWGQDAPPPTSATESADDPNDAELLAPVPHWEMPAPQIVRSETAYADTRWRPPAEASHVATFELRMGAGSTLLSLYVSGLGSAESPFMMQLRKHPDFQQLSDKQRAVMTKDWFGMSFAGPLDPKGFRIYAVSAEDAERLARLLLAKVLEDAVKMTHEEAAKSAALQEQLRSAGAQFDAARAEEAQQCEELARFSRATGLLSKPIAADALAEAGRALRQLAVETAGIEGKKAAIDSARANPKLDETAKSMLERMVIEQDIELAGLLARKRVLAQQQEETRQLVADFESCEHQQAQAKDSLAQLQHVRERLRSARQTLRNIAEHTSLKDNTITIWPMGPEAPQ